MTFNMSAAYLCCIAEKIDDTEAPKVDKNYWVKTMENIVLQLKLDGEVRGDPLAYVIWHHIKVSHISPRYGAYLNLDEKMIAIAPIVDKWSNFKLSQDCLERVYFDYQCDTFKIDNALVYQILLKTCMDMDAYVCMKQRKSV